MTNRGLIVVKIGGSRGVKLDIACADIAKLCSFGAQIIVVHGGSQRANDLGRELGHPARFLRSPSGHISRYTDQRTRGIFVQAVEALNGEIVACLMAHTVLARGMTGKRCIVRGDRKRVIRAVFDGRQVIIRNDFSGHITDVNADLLKEMLSQGVVPVLPPLALSAEDGLLNVDGDRVASTVAVAVDANDLILLSNVPGLLREASDEESLVCSVPYSELEHAESLAEGRMKRKLIGVREALEGGIDRVVMGDGRVDSPLQRALQGYGTSFHREEIAEGSDAGT